MIPSRPAPRRRNARLRLAVLLTLPLVPTAATGRAQELPPEVLATAPPAVREALTSSPRAIRRDVPLTRSIRKALLAGTRDLGGRPGKNYWQLRTDFRIDARLEVETATIHGRETITLHNTSPDDLDRIALRLDHNIFRFGVERGASVPAEQTDGMVVTRITVGGVEALLGRPSGRRRLPADRPVAVGLQDTVAYVLLPEPVEAGSVAEIGIDWHTRLPGGDGGRGHRMTQRWGDALFQPTQWFPRLCKYDDLHGWVTSPYLGPAEFYNNFGTFDVALDVPGGWLVSATGELQNPGEVLAPAVRERLATVLESDDEVVVVAEDGRGPGVATAEGDRLVWRFRAELVNDFAWATARDYVWRATRATIPGRGPVPVHMFFLPERAGLFRRAGVISRHALEFYSRLLVPYPFPKLALQDGPSAGMEYPMVINSNQGAADHEVAHQWWPMMVGTNETMYGWMDEGLNSYMNILSRADVRGRVASLDGRGASYGRVAGSEDEPPMMWSANYGGPRYGFQTYRKTPMMLAMLGGIVGDRAVQEALAEYAEAWAFKHPSPWDFVFFMSARLERDLGWFWNAWLWNTRSVDGSIERVVADAEGGGVVVAVHQAGQMPSPVVLDVVCVPPDADAADGEDPDLAALLDLPGAVAFGDPDARTVRITWPVEIWFGGERTVEVRLPCPLDRLESVVLDPEGRFPDRERGDNAWKRS